jgi:hypothetical protein
MARTTRVLPEAEEIGMDELVNQLVERVGLERETAQKVADFLQEHASDVPRWLAKNETIKGLIDKFGLGNVLGTV